MIDSMCVNEQTLYIGGKILENILVYFYIKVFHIKVYSYAKG